MNEAPSDVKHAPCTGREEVEPLEEVGKRYATCKSGFVHNRRLHEFVI